MLRWSIKHDNFSYTGLGSKREGNLIWSSKQTDWTAPGHTAEDSVRKVVAKALLFWEP
jgi:hypothetical protein